MQTQIEATCDYVRIQHTQRGTDMGEQPAEPEIDASAVISPTTDDFSAIEFHEVSVKSQGEHGRVSRQRRAIDSICDEAEDDAEEGEFWKERCGDVDCIYEGEHCRYDCALAELDEEPKRKAPAFKRALRFRLLVA